MLQTVASLINEARVIIYDRNMFIMQATGAGATGFKPSNLGLLIDCSTRPGANVKKQYHGKLPR